MTTTSDQRATNTFFTLAKNKGVAGLHHRLTQYILTFRACQLVLAIAGVEDVLAVKFAGTWRTLCLCN